MRLPEIAASIRDASTDPRIPPDLAAKLVALADGIGRRKPTRRAPPQSATMTPALAASIRAYHATNPNLSQTAIARHFNVNPGRVSEAINGKRK